MSLVRRYGIFAAFLAGILTINIVFDNPWWSYLAWALGGVGLFFCMWAMNRLDEIDREEP